MDRPTHLVHWAAEVIAYPAQGLGAVDVLPGGGSSELAVRGCSEIPAEIEAEFDVICCPCGTGGTLAGIAAGLKGGQRAIGFSVLKGGGAFLPAAVEALQQ